MGGRGRGGERKDAAGGKKDLRGAVKQEVREEEEEIAGELETPSSFLQLRGAAWNSPRGRAVSRRRVGLYRGNR